jgi:hypothetical protein
MVDDLSAALRPEVEQVGGKRSGLSELPGGGLKPN